MLMKILLNLVIALCAWRVWQWLSDEDDAEEQFTLSKEWPAQDLLFSRIDEAARKLEEQDLNFLARMLAHPSEKIALYSARILARSSSPRAMQLLFDQMERMDEEIRIRRKSRESEPDFYESRLSQPEHPPPQSLMRKIHPRFLENDLERLKVLGQVQRPLEVRDIPPLLEHILKYPELPPEDLYAALISWKALPAAPSNFILEPLLRHPEAAVRQGALEIVAHFRLEQFRMRVEAEVSCAHPVVAAEALYALAEIGSEISCRRVELAQSHPSPLVRAAAGWVLKRLRQRLDNSVSML